MASSVDIKRRIRSANSTAKITKAMQLISAVKMRKVQQNYQNTRDYVSALRKILAEIASTEKVLDNPLLRTTAQEKNALVILVATSRGFVGPQLSKLGNSFYDLVTDLRTRKVNVEVLTVKNKALNLATRYGVKPELHFAENFEGRNLAELTALRQLVIEGFSNQKYDAVYLVYTKFISTMVQEAAVEKFLPFTLEGILQTETEGLKGSYKFEPGTKAIVNRLLADYLEVSLYNTMLSATASEYSARMLTMQKATDNAIELGGKLLVQYNKTRQAAITQQIQEITNVSLS